MTALEYEREGIDPETAHRIRKELDRGPRIQEISEYLETELRRLSAKSERSATTKEPEALDARFLDARWK